MNMISDGQNEEATKFQLGKEEKGSNSNPTPKQLPEDERLVFHSR